MAATAVDLGTNRRMGDTTNIPVVAADIIHRGSLVVYNAAGTAEPATDAAAKKFAGIAKCQVDNSLGAASAETVVCHQRGQFEMAFGGAATQADVGKKVYAVDDQTVDLVGVTANDVYVGVIKEVISAGWLVISIDEAAQAGA